MIEICCGALSAMAVLGAFLAGFAAGRKACELPARGSAAHEESEEEKRLLHEEQRAFENMLHYNMDTAYGLADGAALLPGGEK